MVWVDVKTGGGGALRMQIPLTVEEEALWRDTVGEYDEAR